MRRWVRFLSVGRIARNEQDIPKRAFDVDEGERARAEGVSAENPQDWALVRDWSEFKYSERVVRLADEVMKLEAGEFLELLKLMQNRLGIDDETMWSSGYGSVGVASAAAAGADAGGAEEEAAGDEPLAAPEASTVKLQLTEVSADSKIKLMKEIRSHKPDLKLMDVKALVDKLPSLLFENVEREKAKELIDAFQKAGGVLTMS